MYPEELVKHAQTECVRFYWHEQHTLFLGLSLQERQTYR
jgi:hypothetical protein